MFLRQLGIHPLLYFPFDDLEMDVERVERIPDLMSDSGSETAFSVGAGFDVTENIQVRGGISSSDDGTGYNLGVRFYFGR